MGINASWYKKYLFPSFNSLIFSSNALWYVMTAKCLVIYPFHTLRALTVIRPIAYVTAELAQLYGALRLGFSLFSIWGIFERRQVQRKLMSAIMSITGVFNLYFGMVLLGRGRWNTSTFLPILLVESILTFINIIYALKY